MKNYGTLLTGIMVILALLCLFGLTGCGLSVTSGSAQSAVDDARNAIESAKSSQADTYSNDNLKSAERLLDEAESSLLRNRWQRAGTLARMAEKSAQLAEQEAFEQSGIKPDPVSDIMAEPDTTVIPKSPQLTTTAPLPGDFPTNVAMPQAALLPAQPLVPDTTPSISMQKDISMPELQNRIQAAFQALQSAQNSVQVARFLMVKIQVDIGLLMMHTNMQFLQRAGATPEILGIVQSMYDQAQQSSIAGNYDNALRILDQINAYIRALFATAQ